MQWGLLGKTWEPKIFASVRSLSLVKRVSSGWMWVREHKCRPLCVPWGDRSRHTQHRSFAHQHLTRLDCKTLLCAASSW